MKICLMGSHGVGKTTLLNEYEKQGYEVFPEITRELMLLNVIPKKPSLIEQRLLERVKMMQFNRFLNCKKKCIIDRSPIDVSVYTMLSLEDKSMEYKINMFEREIVIYLAFKIPKIGVKFIYIKPENNGFKPKKDVFRSDNITFFRNTQKLFDIVYHVMIKLGYDIKCIPAHENCNAGVS